MPVLFVILGLALGLSYLFSMPPLQVPDEALHFNRAYSVSTGACVAPARVPVPSSFVRLSETFPSFMEYSRGVTLDDLRLSLRTPLNERDMSTGEGHLLSGCTTYLPAAAALSLGRRLDLPPLVLMYLGRFANLAVYLLLTYLALRALPDLRLLLFCLALMPMTLHEAASNSADAMTIAVGFLFCAYVSKLAFEEGTDRIEFRHHLVLAVLLVAMALNKTLVALGPLLLLIPFQKFGSKRAFWLAMASYALLLTVPAAWWQYANRQTLYAYDAGLRPEGIDVMGNLRLIYRDPILFLAACGRGLYLWRYRLTSEFVGTLGWLSVWLPFKLILGYLAMLGALACTQTRVIKLVFWRRILIAAVIAASIIILFVPVFAWDTEVGTEHTVAPQLQGRYFIPIAFLFVLLLSNAKLRFHWRFLTITVACIILVTNVVALGAIIDNYYHNCPREPHLPSIDQNLFGGG
jgi:uncharacterized membrane protein